MNVVTGGNVALVEFRDVSTTFDVPGPLDTEQRQRVASLFVEMGFPDVYVEQINGPVMVAQRDGAAPDYEDVDADTLRRSVLSSIPLGTEYRAAEHRSHDIVKLFVGILQAEPEKTEAAVLALQREQAKRPDIVTLRALHEMYAIRTKAFKLDLYSRDPERALYKTLSYRGDTTQELVQQRTAINEMLEKLDVTEEQNEAAIVSLPLAYVRHLLFYEQGDRLMELMAGKAVQKSDLAAYSDQAVLRTLEGVNHMMSLFPEQAKEIQKNAREWLGPLVHPAMIKAVLDKLSQPNNVNTQAEATAFADRIGAEFSRIFS